MTEHLPENLGSDDELAEWFENADLSQYNLDYALDVVVSTKVTLSIEGPLGSGAATSGAMSAPRLHVAKQ